MQHLHCFVAKALSQRIWNNNSHEIKHRRKQNTQNGFKPSKNMSQGRVLMFPLVPAQSLCHFWQNSNKHGYLVSDHTVLQVNWKRRMGCGETEDRKWEIQDWNVPQLGNYRNSSPLMITLHSLLFYLLVLELTDLQLQVERNSVLILASPP